MSRDVIGVLEGYAREAEVLAPPISLDEIVVEQSAETVARRRERRLIPTVRRGLAVAAVALVVTIGVVGGIALFGEGESGRATDPTPTTAPGPDEPEYPTTLAATPVEFLTWIEVESASLDVAGRLRSLGPTSHGWIAVGADVDGFGAASPAVWASADGYDWVRVESDEFDLPGTATGVAEHTGRIVVVGSDQTTGAGLIWHSDDGVTWNRVADGGAQLESARIADVMTPSVYSGYVAVGTHVWTSGNGVQWERHDLPDGMANAVTEFPNGLVAAGRTISTGQAAVWVSQDLGATWVAMEVLSQSEFNASSINAVTHTDGGLVAVGRVDDGGGTYPAVWMSSDGAVWNLTWVGGNSPGEFNSVRSEAGLTVAGGTSGDVLPTGMVWQSGDLGLTWVEFDDRSALFASGLDPSPAGVHAMEPVSSGFFFAAGEREGSPAVWIGGAGEFGDDSDDDGVEPGWTCQARIDNGATWVRGTWDAEAGTYTATGPLACLDLLESHAVPQQWKVVWDGSASTLEVGLLIVFEQGIHGTVYAEIEAETEFGEWITPILSPEAGLPFTFVVMPHSFDTWDEVDFEVTPCSLTECG